MGVEGNSLRNKDLYKIETVFTKGDAYAIGCYLFSKYSFVIL